MPGCRFLLFFSGPKDARSLANKRDRLSYLAALLFGWTEAAREGSKDEREKDERMKRKTEEPGIDQVREREREGVRDVLRRKRRIDSREGERILHAFLLCTFHASRPVNPPPIPRRCTKEICIQDLLASPPRLPRRPPAPPRSLISSSLGHLSHFPRVYLVLLLLLLLLLLFLLLLHLVSRRHRDPLMRRSRVTRLLFYPI